MDAINGTRTSSPSVAPVFIAVVLVGIVLHSLFGFVCSALYITACPFVIFVLSVLLRFKASDCTFGIFTNCSFNKAKTNAFQFLNMKHTLGNYDYGMSFYLFSILE
jgi:hypothetical protein